MKDFEEMTVEELITLSEKIGRQIAMKQYGLGYKDGTEDAKRAMEDKLMMSEQERHFKGLEQ